MLLPILQGFGVGLALIIAIGPQNAFVISQGLKRQHVFVTALVCTLADVVLISIGVGGLGSLLALHPLMIEAARWFGAIFLMGYGIKSFYSAIKPAVLSANDITQQTVSVRKIVFTLLALSFLNPHAYIDAIILIGSIASQHHGIARPLFGVGAVIASVIWLFSIAYGARILTPLFKKQSAWRVLDVFVGVVMLTIAASLIIGV